jgi:hypothetical protein
MTLGSPMKRTALFLGIALATLDAQATTFYVRTDGGNDTQCNGQVDAPYDGSGVGEGCAWKNLSWAVGTVGGGTANIAPGDTVIVKNGSYPMGWHADFDTSGCTTTSRSSCYLRPPPSGASTAARTRILGENSETGCKTRPELWGTGGANRIINIDSSANIEYACLEITDHSPCVRKHYESSRLCVTNSGDWVDRPVRGQTASGYLWRDVNIHGGAHTGMYVSGVTDWTMERLRLHANGFAGWNGSFTEDAADYNYGTIHFKQAEISFNGCTENYPSLAIISCIGQNGNDTDGDGPVAKTSGSDGYGDGIGTAHTGGDWIFEDSLVHHNVQDGIDMLYLTQANGSITVRRTKSWANSGNQMKLSGISLVENSVLIGACDYFALDNRYYPAMTISGGDACRASGNPLVIRPANVAGTASTIRFNTITGKGDMLVNISPGDLGASTGTTVSFENNVFYGQAEYSDGSPTELAWIITGTTIPTLSWKNNHVWNVGPSTSNVSNCPGDSFCTAAPQIRDSGIYTFDARPAAASNLLNAGTNCSGTCTIPATDITGQARDASPGRGAYED